jgi:hypothetical protein
MFIGVFDVPMGRFVCGSVAWYMNVPGMFRAIASPHPVAIPAPVLIIVAYAVAGVPTITERLVGRTAATGGFIIGIAAAGPESEVPTREAVTLPCACAVPLAPVSASIATSSIARAVLIVPSCLSRL